MAKQDNWKNRIVGYDVVPADQLLANPANWRIHPKAQQDALTGVLDDVGWVQEIIVNKTTGHVVDGHMRVEVAITRGESVPVKYVELTEAEELLILATIDPISAMAATDAAQLESLLQSVNSDSAAVQAMLAQLAEESGLDYEPEVVPDAGAQIDKADELLQKWQVERGQLWVIPSKSGRGEHRLLCGDSTNADDVARVMAGERAVCMWTDPPYGVSYVGKTKNALTIQNDGAEGLDALLCDAFAASDTALDEGAAIYIAHPAGALSVTFGVRFLAQGWRLHETLVWVKDSMVLGYSDYHYKHEPILFGYKHGGGKRGRGGEGWYGDNSQTSVLEFARPKASEMHPTMKPIELVNYCLKNSSPLGGVVFEPFTGSGTTLVACEQTGRLGRGLELEPKYCAVILQRLTDMGLTPKLAE